MLGHPRNNLPTSAHHPRIFGCIAYAHIRQDKLEPRALKCCFIGYPDGVEGYKLWCLEEGFKKCMIIRDVVFNWLNSNYKNYLKLTKVTNLTTTSVKLVYYS